MERGLRRTKKGGGSVKIIGREVSLEPRELGAGYISSFDVPCSATSQSTLLPDRLAGPSDGRSRDGHCSSAFLLP
jgi:hypothetical protein